MKSKFLVVIALMLVLTMSLSSCGAMDWLKDFLMETFGPEIELTDAPLNAETLIDFANGANPDVLFESDGWSNGDVFNVVWKKHNVHYEDGIMRLGISEEKASAWINDAEVEYNYTAGEARTQNYYHYGDYEVSMKPSANAGTASTFFVCTGPYDLKNGVPNAHDEIDIEFLGKDTTHVQFNFFVDGVGGNEFMYDLGFDASEEFHTYGFRWEENAITWFVDGKPVYKVTTDTSVTEGKNIRIVEKLPSTAGRILTNYWCGNEGAWGWMGKYQGEQHDNGTTYQWIKTSAVGAPLNPAPEQPPVDGGDEIDWTAIEPIAPTFATTPEYTVEIDGNKANVTYTDVSGSAYKPVEMDVTEAVAGKNYVYLKVTNNGTETVNVRVNMYDPTLTSQNTATNISATMNGEAVRTDLEWGGSFFDIPAGETAELVVHFGVGGIKLQLMIDSSRNDSVLRSGDVTIEDIKFAAVGEVVAPHKCADADEDGKCDECGEDMPLPPPPAPADPESGNLTTTVGGVVVELGGNTSDGYGVHGNEEDGTIRVEYTNISTNTYKNVWAGIADVAAGKTEVSLKIKNNGTETAYITVKIEAAGAVALMEGKMEIPAGEEQTYTGTFEGVADKLYFFIDSGWSEDTTTHAGEVVISEIAFAGESEPTPEPVAPIVNISDLTITATTGEELIPGTGISASSGLAIDANNKSIDGFDFTQRLKLGGTMKVEEGIVKAGIEVVTNGPAKIILYAISSSSTDSTRTLQLATLTDGALVKLAETAGVDGAAIAKYELTVDAAGTYYIGSTKSGINVYYIAVENASTPEPKPEEPTVEYTDIYVEFKTENAYTLETPDTYANQVRVIYADMAQNSWANINIWVEDKSADCSVFSFKLTNHGEATVSVWVQMKDAAGAELINQNVDIAAGAEQVVTFNYTGTAQMIFFFVDSTHEADAALNTGDITISELKLGKVAATEEPPVQEELNLEWWTSSSDYSVNGNNIKYNGLGNSYSCAGAPITSLASGKTTFTVTITNNGEADSRVRIDIQGENQVGNHTVLNTSATGGDVWTDMEWGGSAVTVKAGESVTLVITYDETTERGAVTNLVVMVDSGRGTGDTFDSDVTLSGMSFQ